MNPSRAQMLFQQAAKLQQAGQLAQAEAVYREFLSLEPRHPRGLLYLSMILHARGAATEAVELLRRAIEVEPWNVELHNNLGVYLLVQGKFAEAEPALRKAISLKPDHAKAYNNLGNVLRELGRLEEAVASHQKAISLDPRNASAHNNLGSALAMLKRFAEAKASFTTALSLGYDPGKGFGNLAAVAGELGNLPESIEYFRKAIALQPNNLEFHNSLGAALYDLNQFESACEAFSRAISVQPNHTVAMTNLGGALHSLHRTQEAIAIYRHVLSIDPNSKQAMNNLGFSLRDIGQRAEARKVLEKAVEIDPNYAEGQLNLSFSELLDGDLESGLTRNEWRFKAGTPLPGASLGIPRWEGESFEGKTVLVTYEQGLGDVIHFARYLPMVKARGGSTGRVILWCQPPLMRLMQLIPEVDEVESIKEAPKQCDFHVPIISLPRIFGTRTDSIPGQAPYITIPQDQIARWKSRIDLLPSGNKVGLAWKGNSRHKNDRFRSLPPELLLPILQIPGINFISLQKGESSVPPSGVVTFENEIENFLDSAGLMMNLNLIISVDTSVVHLAGALGRNVWTLLPANPDWRWGVDSSSSPWYATMKLFRQSSLGDWSSVISQIQTELKSRF